MILAAAVVICGGLGFYLADRLASPDIKLLVPEQGAQWIRHRRPFTLTAWGPTEEAVFFRKRIVVSKPGGPAEMTVRALRTCLVYCDRKQLFVAGKPDEWKEPHRVLLPDLTPGEHVIEILAANSFGPAAILAACEPLGLRTGPDWEESVLENAVHGRWEPALTADDVEPPPLSRPVETPFRALCSSAAWLGPLFLFLWGVFYWTARNGSDAGAPPWWTASRVRWFVLVAWFVLAANNFLKLPAGIGYDLPSHVDYIRFIAERGELPDARDGLQMFQAPLFYAFSALVDRALMAFVSSAAALLWLRWIPLACGVAMAEISFRSARLVFPERDDLQSLATLLGGLLPMNVYMSQTLGNEPLCGVLSALVLLACWRALRDCASAGRPRIQWVAGLLLGLGLLAKVSALLLTPVLAAVLAWTNRRRGLVPVLAAWARCFGAAAVVSGWYYGRNWLRFGKLFVGGWDPARGFPWWQDPGYSTVRQLVSFGRSLTEPIHAGFFSIGDGFYSTLWLDGNLSAVNSSESFPPWNLGLLLAAPWPALLLSVALVAGALRGICCRDAVLRQSLQVAAGTLLVYLAAFVLLALEVPAYSQAKASYTLGLTPAYAVLCVAGIDLLPRSRPLRSAAAAFIGCWSVLVYATYFAL